MIQYYEFFRQFNQPVFYAVLFGCYATMLALMQSIAYPKQRVWPPPGRGSWQYVLTWTLWAVIFGGNFYLLVFDWNTWRIPDGIRYFLGLPSIVLGGALVGWGVRSLGVNKTSGLHGGLVAVGAYRLSRNPQYVGDLLLFGGIALLANSELVLVARVLTVLSLWLAVPAEEPWLEEKYGEAYLAYKRETARFL